MVDVEIDTSRSDEEATPNSPTPPATHSSNATLQVPTEPPTQRAGKTRSTSPSTIPSPRIIKAQSQVCRFESLQELQADIPEDVESTSPEDMQALLDKVEELHKAFLSEHAHLEEFWPVKCLNNEYFTSSLEIRDPNLGLNQRVNPIAIRAKENYAIPIRNFRTIHCIVTCLIRNIRRGIRENSSTFRLGDERGRSHHFEASPCQSWALVE